MSINVTEIIVALIGTLATVLTAVAIPWIRAKIGSQRWEQFMQIISVAVHAAEQMADAGVLDDSFQKLEYALARVKEMLTKQGITYDDDIIRAAIEAAVLTLKQNQNKKIKEEQHNETVS